MLEITIGQYVKGDSFLHRLDPRTKIIGTLLLMIALFVANDPLIFTLVAALVIGIILASQVPLSYYLRGLKPLIFILVFTAMIQLFLTPGEVVWSWRFLSITIEGIRLAFFMCCRLVLLLLITSVLTLTTTPLSLTDAIETLLNPFRRIGVPAHELAMMMTIALRFIPTLIDETDKIMKAQKSRGADFSSGGLIDRARSLLPILVPLFLSAFQRADDLAMAMEARAYRGGEGRTRLHELVYGSQDYISQGFLLLFLFGVIAWRIWNPFL